MTTDISTAFSILDQSSDTTSTASTTTETPVYEYAHLRDGTLNINLYYNGTSGMVAELQSYNSGGKRAVFKIDESLDDSEQFYKSIRCQRDILTNRDNQHSLKVVISRDDKCTILADHVEQGPISYSDTQGNQENHATLFFSSKTPLDQPDRIYIYAIAAGRSEILAGSPIYKALNDPDANLGRANYNITYSNQIVMVKALLPACLAEKHSYLTCLKCIADPKYCDLEYKFEEYDHLRQLFSSVTQAKLKETQCVNSNDVAKIITECSNKMCSTPENKPSTSPSSYLSPSSIALIPMALNLLFQLS